MVEAMAAEVEVQVEEDAGSGGGGEGMEGCFVQVAGRAGGRPL